MIFYLVDLHTLNIREMNIPQFVSLYNGQMIDQDYSYLYLSKEEADQFVQEYKAENDYEVYDES